MREYLLPESGQFYKANLHSHTCLSDGTLTPEQMRDRYRAKGYSVLAFTEHEVLVPHPELRTEDFLPLNGTELSITEKDRRDKSGKKFHLCCIAPSEDCDLTPCFHPEHLFHNAEQLRTLVHPDPASYGFEHTYSPEQINRMMRLAKQSGFFLTYNHPDWSLEELDSFSRFEGMDAIEIYNNACELLGFEAYRPTAYDALLRRGRRIFCVAADDNHNAPKRRDDSFGGWVMIKAERLDYPTIFAALQQGHFYASRGPEIRSLFVEDGILHVECSEAEKIRFTTAIRHRKQDIAEEGSSLTASEFRLLPQDGFVRVTVTDHRGRTADSNAYFL